MVILLTKEESIEVYSGARMEYGLCFGHVDLGSLWKFH